MIGAVAAEQPGRNWGNSLWTLGTHPHSLLETNAA
jgi:hypothetical protein